MNVLVLLALIAIAVGLLIAYRYGNVRGRREASTPAPPIATPASAALPTAAAARAPSMPPEPAPAPAPAPTAGSRADLGAEKARIVVAYEAEAAALRRRLAAARAAAQQAEALAEDRRRLLRELADARAETARYRQVLVDLENNAPPPLLDHPGAPDDLKLIVGIGPVLERMLHQIGVSTYRQIARWTERDIDEFDARLAEFPGRIRRDAWVTQARALHQSKYGEPPPSRDRA